jgi:hypothetical protein
MFINVYTLKFFMDLFSAWYVPRAPLIASSISSTFKILVADMKRYDPPQYAILGHLHICEL